jgi:hypothetical protein
MLLCVEGCEFRSSSFKRLDGTRDRVSRSHLSNAGPKARGRIQAQDHAVKVGVTDISDPGSVLLQTWLAILAFHPSPRILRTIGADKNFCRSGSSADMEFASLMIVARLSAKGRCAKSRSPEFW